MSKKLLQIKNSIKSQIDKLDKFVKNYNESSKTVQIPSSAYMNWGIDLAQRGKLDEAMEKLQTAALMANQNPGVYINIGIAMLKQKNFEEAIKNFRKAVKIDKFNSI